MPGTVIPIRTTYPLGLVSIVISDGSESYSELQQSFASNFFKLIKMHYHAGSLAQLTQPFRFIKYDVNGNRAHAAQVVAADPKQIQPAVNIPFEKDNIVLTGQNYFEITLLPYQQIYVVLYVVEGALKNLLPPAGFYPEEFFGTFTQLAPDAKF